MGGDRRRPAASRGGGGGFTVAHPPPPGAPRVAATLCARSPAEAADPAVEIKAYKLGKKRWSYNQCELRVERAGGGGGCGVAPVRRAL